MKFLLLFCVLSSKVNAQPILQASNSAPVIGESFKYYVADSSSVTAIMNIALQTGPNRIWDFSAIHKEDSINVNYFSPSSSIVGNAFPSAEIMEEEAGELSFLDITTDSMAIIGDSIGMSMWKVERFSNPIVKLKFPFSYGNTFNDTYLSSWYYPDFSSNFGRTGSITANAVGFGSLIMPYGTVHNVLQIKISSENQMLMEGVSVGQWIDTILYWYQPGTHYPVISFSNVENGNYSSRFLSSSNVLLSNDRSSQNNLSDISVYPNPTKGEFCITTSGKLQTASLIDPIGKVICEFNNPDSRLKVNLEGFTPGVYYLVLNYQDYSVTKKIILIN
ncbi:MAG: T9SS type A sorting domain-containing protein [Bacteroidota bacterium]